MKTSEITRNITKTFAKHNKEVIQTSMTFEGLDTIIEVTIENENGHIDELFFNVDSSGKIVRHDFSGEVVWGTIHRWEEFEATSKAAFAEGAVWVHWKTKGGQMKMVF